MSELFDLYACAYCDKQLKSRHINAFNMFSGIKKPNYLKGECPATVEDMDFRGKSTTYLCDEHYEKLFNLLLKLRNKKSI